MREKATKGKPRHVCKQPILTLGRWSICRVDALNLALHPQNARTLRDVSYLPDIESALTQLFRKLLDDKIACKKGYTGAIEDLRTIIIETRKEFESLLDVTPLIRPKEGVSDAGR